MKALSPLLFALLLFSLACASKPPTSSPVAGPETTLNASAHYLDHIFMETLASLELIAATPEAQRGEWSGIKPYLERLEARLPGVYFYVLPDGNYYSLALDYTNLNLSDRAYFDSLFAGNEVRGFPIYSRSSGKKSALMAAPIVVDGRVTGALGASVFLDDLHARLNRELALPSGNTWFVLNEEGDVMLDRDRDFIFMNPLAQGSPSLRQGVAEALKNESGAFQYESQGFKSAHYRKLPEMNWWMFLARTEGEEPPAPPKLRLSLERFVPELQARLTRIDESSAELIETADVTLGEERYVRDLLDAIVRENPSLVSASFVNAEGVLRFIQPADYRNFEDTDISGQEIVAAMRDDPKPVLSPAFTAAEGFMAVDIARPLFDDQGRYAGFISALIRPRLLVEPILRDRAVPEDYELWIMQTDGVILYDQNEEEIGRNLFTDPLYADHESLQKLGGEISAAPSGEGSYIFASPETGRDVIKNAVWQTVRLHGREWRVVLAYRPYEQRNSR